MTIEVNLVNPQLNVERLLQLADILDQADEIHDQKHEPLYLQSFYRHSCGTPACALGHWAAAHPERWAFVNDVPWLIDVQPYQNSFHKIELRGHNAAAIEFGLKPWQSRLLFGEFGCGNARSSQEAAAYIREFVRRQLNGGQTGLKT